MFLVFGAAGACTGKPETDQSAAATAADAAPASTAGCANGFLKARLRGALDTDLDWRDAGMRCEGGPRPGGKGLRVTMAGPIPDSGEPARQLRFIFGIATRDIAPGAAQALPTNVTIIMEGGGQMFATRGDGHCAVEKLERTPLAGDASRQRVHARGYCLDPAGAMSGDGRLHVPTFEFSGVVDAGEKP